MPQSRNRAKHRHHSHPHTVQPGASHHSHPKVKRSAALVVALLAAIFGLAIAYFTRGADLFWIAVGTGSGAIVGYLVGRSMDRSIAKR